MQDQIKCPKCGSEQITANKKGYSVGKAAAGVVLTGGIGLIAGAHGSGKIIVSCLKCGEQWNPKKEADHAKSIDQQRAAIATKSLNDWKKQFMHLYDSGRVNEAEDMHNEKFGKNCSVDTIP